MRRLSENKLSNSYDGEKFSSVNFAFIVIIISVIAISIYQGLNYIKGWSLLEISFLVFFMLNVVILIKKKFPLFISSNPVMNYDMGKYGEKYEKNIGFLGCLYLLMFTAEPSYFVSLFSGTKLTLYKQHEDNTFRWHSNDTKILHRVLDFIFMVVAIIGSYLLITYCYKTKVITKALMLVLAILTLAFKLERTILYNMFSVKVKSKEGIKLKVLYNYSVSNIRFSNFYGIAEPWTKSVIVKNNDINPVVKEFIIAHETGHIRDTSFIFMNTFMALFEVIYIFGLLFVLNGMNQNKHIILALIGVYFVYALTLKYKMYESSEFFADKCAVNIIGEKKCIEAINMMTKKDTKTSDKIRFMNLLIKIVPIQRRIKAISDVKSKN